MRRIIMLLAAAALLAVMMVASAAPAMANHLFDDNDLDHFGVFNDRGDLFDGCIGSTIFGHCTGVGALDDDDVRFFDGFRHHDRFGDDDEDLDVIRVGDFRCLVEDGDDVEFCVNKDTGEIFNV